MRFRSAFRLLVACLAFSGTLASPLVALAHGEAHEHAAHADEPGEHGALTRVVDAAVQHTGAPVLLAADHGDHDAGLHSDGLARVGAHDVASIGEAPITPIKWALGVRGPTIAPPRVTLAPLGRAAPPDQPRAPPVG